MKGKSERIEIKTLQSQNIRTSMDGAGLERLAASLQKGQKFPIVVTASGKIIDGHRRVAAAQLAGITHLDAIVVDDDLTPEQITELQAVHAFHSETLGDSDKANALKLVKESKGLNNKQLAEHFDIDPSAVTQFLSLFSCIPAVQALAAQGKIGHTKWYAISGSDDQEESLRLHNSGATRADLQQKTRKAKAVPLAPADMAKRITLPPVGKAAVVIAARKDVEGKSEEISLDDALEAVQDAARQIKAAQAKGISAATAARYFKDIMAAG